MRVVLMLASAMLLTVAVDAQELHYSTFDQRQFSFLGNPDRIYVRPGNDGYQMFSSSTSSHPGNLQPWQDEYCDAREIILESPDYSISLSSRDASVTAAYRARLTDYMKGCSMEALLPCWVINEDFRESWFKNNALAGEVTSAALEYQRGGYVVPLIVFDIPHWNADAEELYEAFHSRLPHWPLAVRVSEANFSETLGRRWACVIADEEVVPQLYRGQCIARWLHNQYGQVPVFVSPAAPDFLREVVWSTAGVAGIWYRPLPAGDTEANRRAATHLRASSVFFNRFGSDIVKLAPKPEGKGFVFNLETEGKIWAGALQGDVETVEMQSPGWMIGRAVGTAWYNPATDENIIEPLTTATEKLTLKPPSNGLWVYSRTLTNLVPDTNTTVTTINPWPE